MITITKDTLIADLLKVGNTDAVADVLQSIGMHCLHCAIAHQETLEEAALVHGINIDELLVAVNEAINS